MIQYWSSWTADKGREAALTREEFIELRNMGGKAIQGNITLEQFGSNRHVYQAIVTVDGCEPWSVELQIQLNATTGYMSLNVTEATAKAGSKGPICRWCTQGPPHKDLGPDHKHDLLGPLCPGKNLEKGVRREPALANLDLEGFLRFAFAQSGILFSGKIAVDYVQ
jgi:hypothetical protein